MEEYPQVRKKVKISLDKTHLINIIKYWNNFAL
jgi:hypothetical protein